jgi:hypothetical protein
MHGGDGAPAREGAALEGTGGAFKNASQLSALYSQYYAVRLSPTYTRPVHVYGTQGLCTCTVLKVRSSELEVCVSLTDRVSHTTPRISFPLFYI